MFLLDTDHLGILQRGTDRGIGPLRQRLAAYSQADFHVSIVSFHEQCLGWNAYISRARTTAGVVHGYRMFQRILSDFAAAQVLPFDDAAGAAFDALRSQKVRVPTMDLRIAAIALARGLTVLSRNLRDFAKVPRLKVEDWTVE